MFTGNLRTYRRRIRYNRGLPRKATKPSNLKLFSPKPKANLAKAQENVAVKPRKAGFLSGLRNMFRGVRRVATSVFA